MVEALRDVKGNDRYFQLVEKKLLDFLRRGINRILRHDVLDHRTVVASGIGMASCLFNPLLDLPHGHRATC